MLDLEMVSAICPACAILYVGANSASFNDLAAAVDRAAILGATVISNSYGGNEFSGETVWSGAVYALSGDTSGIPAALAYSAPNGSLFDVTSGSNGRCVKGRRTNGAYLCTGVTGYDGPTGNGTPNGTGAC